MDDQTFDITANPEAYPAWKSRYSDFKMTGKKIEGVMTIGDFKSCDVLYLHSQDEIKDSFRAVDLYIERTEMLRPSTKLLDQKMFISIQGRKSVF